MSAFRIPLLGMHDSSSAPQDWLAIINQYGGDIPETYGVPAGEIVEGIKYGVRKVSIDTDLRLLHRHPASLFGNTPHGVRPAPIPG